MKDLNVTVMFPYPSGSGLHVGHFYNYAIMDSYCRYKRYLGYNVFQPFGYDSFGLPAENYARQVGRDPREITYQNIENFRKQMENMDTQYEEFSAQIVEKDEFGGYLDYELEEHNYDSASDSFQTLARALDLKPTDYILRDDI